MNEGIGWLATTTGGMVTLSTCAGLLAIAFITLGFCAGWIHLGLYLGKKQRQLRDARTTSGSESVSQSLSQS